jgi:ABC-2 type transport system ATP-binding protein
MIELTHLTKRFGDLVAVDDLTLTVPRGELFALLGPNAAGKTTTIRLITGLLRPTAGQVCVAGFDVQRQPLEARRRLAYVPDIPFLYDKLTPAEFFRFTGQLFRLGENQLQTDARALTDQFGLEPFLDKPIEGLSQGTRQRVTIVSALLHAPEVFVLDEPMVGLDPHHSRVLKNLLKDQARRGVTILISTHQLAVAEELADRVGIMHRGRLIAVGTRDDLRRQTGHDGALEQTFLALTSSDAGVSTAPGAVGAITS